jgi:hypothetical protein
MARGRKVSAPARRVWIIMNNEHANRVREEIYKFNALANTSDPYRRRRNSSIVTALQLIYNQPDGFYEDDLRSQLLIQVMPQLSAVELAELLQKVRTIVPLREESDAIRRIREERRERIWSS